MNYKKFLFSACAVMATTSLHAEELTVQIWGSTWQNLVEPASKRFEEATGIAVNVVTQSTSGEGLAKLQAERNNPVADVWFTTNSVAATAAQDQELFTKIPLDQVPNTEGLMDGSYNEDWVAMYYYPIGIMYDTDTVPFEINEWSDLWRPELGRSIIAPTMSIYQGALLMVANELNGGTIDNVDPGFEALRELNSNISLYYTSDSQARQSFAQGEGNVLIGQSAHYRRLLDEGFNVRLVTPEPAPMYFDVMMMVNGDNQENAAKFIDFISSQAEQEKLAAAEYMTPVHASVELPASLAEIAPADDARMVLDDLAIAERISDWIARFEEVSAR